VNSILEKAGRFWLELSSRLGTRRDATPIDSVAKLRNFVGTHSAYVAQKTLYGYVKARMGTRYPRMFEDDAIIASIDIAKQQVFAACLSDLTIYAVATALHDQPVGDAARRELSQRCYQAALHEHDVKPSERWSAQDCIAEFERRIDGTDWRFGARQPENFTHSPGALVRWAPIADELKRFDTEIVENSIKFAWREVREQFRNRIDGNAVCADWLRLTGS
jgi:hypothetical protein